MEEKFEKMSIWGWGLETFQISPSFFKSITKSLSFLGFQISPTPLPLPEFNSLTIPEPRFTLPQKFAVFSSCKPRLRLRHTYGKSTREILKALNGVFENVPDYVAFPRDEESILELLHFCSLELIAVVPFGGGSSVVGGINVQDMKKYKGTIVINLLYLNKLIELNTIDQTATFQAGIYGPFLEKVLLEKGYTFRNYPQSFEFSTLGGWVATHSGGHFATGRTHIDEAVRDLKILTPIGKIETKEIPPDGAGPYHNPIFLGSEGILGIISQVTIKILKPAKFRLAESVHFEEFYNGINAIREICQQGILPANCRLFDKSESFGMGIGSGNEAVLLLGFESIGADNLETLMSFCVEICKKHKGFIKKKKSEENKSFSTESDSNFRENFTKAPYLRNELLRRGVLVETLESVIPYSKFEAFHEKMMTGLYEQMQIHFKKAVVTCRITHCYTDGIAPYYTLFGQMENLELAVEKWDEVKTFANNVIVEMGASITHHHAVGRDHSEGLKKMSDSKMIEIMKAIKNKVDPKGIMNPGVLINI